MKTVSIALYCEGNTDRRFLPPIITRTARRLLDRFERYDVEVLPIRPIEVVAKKQKASIVMAARQAAGDHILIIHADADHPDAYKARLERFEPGYQSVQRSRGAICKDVLPVIPVQAIEAWMLADHEQLRLAIGTKMEAHALGIPEKARMVESIARPKQKLREAVQKAYASRPKRKREVDIDFLYQLLGEQLKLDRLDEVPAYQQFVFDLTKALERLGFIPRIFLF